MKKLLYITHLSGRRVNRFWLSAIKAANELGYEFHLACNMEDAEHPFWESECQAYHIIPHQIDFHRNPLHMGNWNAARQLERLLKRERFDIIYCNTPVGGVIGRLCAKNAAVPKVIYQAHGFHFWKGAPLLNWLVYYPVERWLAHYTDVMITMNREDFERGKHFKAKNTVYIPGVGIDTNLFCGSPQRNMLQRDRLGIPRDAIVLLSVGELIKRKNHKLVIEVLPALDNVWLVICGQGPLLEAYRKLARKLGVENRVIFTGYKTDIKPFYDMSDIFVFPSFQEGLPVSVMEAMASGLMCIVSNIRGNADLIENREFRFPPDRADYLIDVLKRVLMDKSAIIREGQNNREKVDQYKMENIVRRLKEIMVDTKND